MATAESLQSPSSPVELAFAVAELQRDRGSRVLVESSAGTNARLSGSGDDVAETLANALMTFHDHQSRADDCRIPAMPRSKKGHDSEEGVDFEEKLARNRERNREHARKTRLRKKAHLETLQSKARVLEAQRQSLKQQVEECSIASILLGLSSGSEFEKPLDDPLLAEDSAATVRSGTLSSDVTLLSGSSRKRFLVDVVGEKKAQPLKLNIDGQLMLVGGGKTHVNWKTGAFLDGSGNQMCLTEDQLEYLRRERNRIHAKMTRDRKKCFIAKIEKTIEDLESDIERMKDVLANVSNTKLQMVTPAASPELQPVPSPRIDSNDDDEDESSVYSAAEPAGTPDYPPLKRIRHQFSIGD